MSCRKTNTYGFNFQFVVQDQLLEIPSSITQYNSTEPQTTASNTSIKLNLHLFKTAESCLNDLLQGCCFRPY